LARRRGVEVASTDDFRVMLQGVVSAERDPALHRFRGDPNIATYPPAAHAERWMGMARSVSAALEPVVAMHLASAGPVLIEGDAVDPALAARADYAGRAAEGRVRGLLLHEHDPAVIAATVRERGRRAPGRGFGSDPEELVMAYARASGAYGDVLKVEAERLGVPVLACRPWATLLRRAEEALSTPTG
jgi:2-phosphoglycerate kinase